MIAISLICVLCFYCFCSYFLEVYYVFYSDVELKILKLMALTVFAINGTAFARVPGREVSGQMRWVTVPGFPYGLWI